MKLIIQDKVMGRFSDAPTICTEKPLHLDIVDDVLVLSKDGSDSWEQQYNECVLNCVNRLTNWFDFNRHEWLWSINKVYTTDGNFALLPGRFYDITYNPEEPSNLTIGKRILGFMYDLKSQYIIMHRFVMCIHHYLKNLRRRLLNSEPPYGIVQRYLGAQACWNLNMFSTNFIVDAFATVDSVNIILGYVNKTCKKVNVKFEVDITAQGKGLGLLGIYLDSASTTYDPSLHSIKRNFVTEDGESDSYADITNPNDCRWQFGGSWSNAKILQEFKDVDKNVKCTYLITKNPYVTGYVRYSDSARCTFHIGVKATATFVGSNYQDVRLYDFDVSCAALEQGYNPEYPKKEEEDT